MKTNYTGKNALLNKKISKKYKNSSIEDIKTYLYTRLFTNGEKYIMKKYDENSIKTLDSLEHIRLRSGMYIGKVGNGTFYDDGIYILAKEIIDNCIDEFIMGFGKNITVSVDFSKGSVSVRDYGRGIPLGKVIECVSKINTGAKYNSDVFQFSVGLNGVGTKAVNALSELFIVKSFRDKRCRECHFAQGIITKDLEYSSSKKNGTYIHFIPDKSIFKSYEFLDKHIRKRIWHYAYLNKNLVFEYNGEKIFSKNGLLDLLVEEIPGEHIYQPVYFCKEKIELTFVHTNNYGENYFSFVNGQYTVDGGVHLSAFKEGVLKGINEFANKNYNGQDVREGIFGIVAVKVIDPIFESQTKNKLNNTELRSAWVQEIKELVFKYLHQNKETSKKLMEKITFNEKLRNELLSVKKDAKEKQKKISFKIPKLRDCKFHLNDKSIYSRDSSIFITEGDSASASIIASRNPYTQAVFSLRGKPMNVFGLKRDCLYKNEEMFYIVNALNIENDISQLRYNKIIIATDADVDGMHIRNLLITFFLTFFERLVFNGHLWILETPLFKIRNKNKIVYCYSEEEKESSINTLGKNAEITRFKGLGEISPKEFKQFIGDDIKLRNVSINVEDNVKSILNFCMGKNTSERKKFITDNLICNI